VTIATSIALTVDERRSLARAGLIKAPRRERKPAAKRRGRRTKVYSREVLDHVLGMSRDGAKLHAIARYLGCSTTTAHGVREIARHQARAAAEQQQQEDGA
jgi:hypothetical protein